MITGLFTVEEYLEYKKNSSSLNKRMMNIILKRLQDNLQGFKIIFIYPPNTIGKLSSTEHITIPLSVGDPHNFNVHSITYSFRIILVNDALKILLSLLLPLTSLL